MAFMGQSGKLASEAAPAARPNPWAWVDGAPFFQAGLAGYSDAAMRLIARRHGCAYCVTEAVLDRLLLAGGRGLKQAELDDADHPIAGQIMGSDPGEMAAAARLLVTMGYDVIDLNLACPVRKIRRRSRGGHLLSAPDQAVAILAAVREAVGDATPLSVKLRRAFDDTPQAAADFHRIFEAVIELGYSAATVHGRTVVQKYIGPSDWSFLADLTGRYRAATSNGFYIFGSGDIDRPEAIFDMIAQTGVQGVSVARGCIGNPWIFHQARQLAAGTTPTPPTIDQQRDVLGEHFDLSVKLHGEELAGRMMRKFGIKFARHHADADAVAKAFIAVKNLADWHAVLDAFYAVGEPVTESRARWAGRPDA